MAEQQAVQQGITEDTKTIVTVILLIVMYPIGVIVMWFWPKWKGFVKILLTIPAILTVLFMAFIILVSMAAVTSPSESIRKAECMSACVEKGSTKTECTEQCAFVATPSASVKESVVPPQE